MTDPDPSPPKPPRLSAEQWVLLAGLAGFFIFLWIIGVLLLPMLAHRPGVTFIVLPPALVDLAARQGFSLPPTWTPTPAPPFVPTPAGTVVVPPGLVPTRLYTPQPTSAAGIPMPQWAPRLTVLDLARIMQGESPGDKEAAYMVGWVAKNRLLHQGYGDTYADVSHGFFGYRPNMNPNKEFLQIARRVIKSREDPTGGCLYALSRTDITNLGIPPARADVAYGEWFFFKTWPLTYPNK